MQALLAVQNGQLYDAYELYYKAGAYTDAHDIAVHDLAPDAVIRQDLELLGTLFARFAGKQIVGWHVRGKVCLSFPLPGLVFIQFVWRCVGV